MAAWVFVAKITSLDRLEALQICQRLRVCHECDITIVWCSKNFKDFGKLVVLCDGEPIRLDASACVRR